MASQAAAAAKYANSYQYGSAAPVRAPYLEPRAKPADIPVPGERAVPREKPVEKSTYGISLFAIVGVIFAGVLMVFVVLAQISYNEITSETVRLNQRLTALTEQERKLEIAFESVVNMEVIERVARDEFGMVSPESDQMAVMRAVTPDRAEILRGGTEADGLRGLGSFLSSLLEYFK